MSITIIVRNGMCVEADSDIPIKGGGCILKIGFQNNKQFVLRKIKRYRGIIRSEN